MKQRDRQSDPPFTADPAKPYRQGLRYGLDRRRPGRFFELAAFQDARKTTSFFPASQRGESRRIRCSRRLPREGL
jgi:hypothetical protein